MLWTVSLGLSLLNSFLLPASYMQMIADEDYVASLNLRPDADSFGLALAGALVFAMTLAVVHIVFHFIFIVVFWRKGVKSVNLGEIRYKKGETWFNALRIAGYLISALLVYGYPTSYFRFYPLECLFYITLIILVLLYVTWAITLFRPASRG